ncbi:c-type cytochrome biogenesis protein CcmI [Radicibacter daui]|uniref:c-type cytochrome biogenesis protein CcmI n=1 Tax=Radicibacter daui TaxID=3064829 RepID=UPI004046F542
MADVGAGVVMVFWLVAALLMAAAVAALVWPLLRSPADNSEAGTAPLPEAQEKAARIYRDQLAELARDVETGALSPEAAAPARAEIARRLLALDKAEAEPGAAAGRPVRRLGRPARLVLALLLVFAIPAGALGLYWRVGSPALVGVHVNRPVDAAGWAALGRQRFAAGDGAAAADALREALRLAGQETDTATADILRLKGELAEALVMAAGGQVTEEAGMLLSQVAAQEPDDPRTRYYQALALEQQGKREAALAAWQSFLAISPPDAPWVDGVRQHIAALGGAETPDQAGMPSGDEAAAIAALPPEQQQARIEGMVAGLAQRLEAAPDDVDGWLRLGRAYRVLGRLEESATAFGRAASLKPEDDEIAALEAQSLVAAAPAGAPLPEAALVIYRRLLAREPKSGPALWYLGQAAADAGDVAAAQGYWQRLRDLLPEGSSDRGLIEQALTALASMPAGQQGKAQ